MHCTPLTRAIRHITASLLLASLCAAPALGMSVARKKQLARTQFETAERMREALNGTPTADRSRRDYMRVIDAYRRVYYIAPTSNRADSSVVAVAELLAEMGHRFNDDKLSLDAVKQYEFLRREYPGSKYRFDALFTMAQIYREDLGDNDQAKATFQEFLQHYPHNHLADQAKQEIAEIDAEKTDKSAKKDAPKPEDKASAKQSADDVSDSQEPVTVSDHPRGRLPLVTGIRHWSTPDYTRVAIDLEQEVKYEAGRVPNPDRIFFDLHETKLASALVGKSFDVDDGFLKKIRVAQYQVGMTRVVLEVDDVSDYSAFFLPNPYRLIIDIHGRKPPTVQAKAPEHPAEEAQARSESEQPKGAEVTTTAPRVQARAFGPQPLPENIAPGDPSAKPDAGVKKIDDSASSTAKIPEPKPAELSDDREVKATRKPTTGPTFAAVVPREKGKKAPKRRASDPDDEIVGMHEAAPTSDGDRSLIRALGLKIGKIVIDAGHGGHDTGTIGPHGLEEKDLVLDVALRLGKLLENRLGADVVYTRDDDTFVPLETRTAIANQAQADLFISIHANSSHDPKARGVETYYLNFTSSADALEVAARENAVSDKSIHELQDLVKKIALKEKIEESREFAADVQQALYTSLSRNGIRNRGVKKAPFIVLIGANMPSILAEISFVSNPTDEKKLRTPEYRQKIAESLYRGIAKYADGLSGIKVAARTDKDAAQ